MRVEAVPAEEFRRGTAWRRLYERSFPACVREPMEVIVRSTEDGRGTILRMRPVTVGGKAVHTMGLATLQ